MHVFERGTKAIQWVKDNFLKMELEQLDSQVNKMNIGPQILKNKMKQKPQRRSQTKM